jgi:hypothetical protein
LDLASGFKEVLPTDVLFSSTAARSGILNEYKKRARFIPSGAVINTLSHLEL